MVATPLDVGNYAPGVPTSAHADRAPGRHAAGETSRGGKRGRSRWAGIDREADEAAALEGEPRYVTACRRQAWTMASWSKGSSTPSIKRGPARCKSWRHLGPCAEHRASVDWRRVADAFEGRKASDSVLLVLTLARTSSPDGPAANLKRWADPAGTWHELGPLMWKLFHRLQRWCCKESGCERPVTRRRRRRRDDPDGRWRKGDEYGKPYTRQACVGECDRLLGRYVSVVEQHSPHGRRRERWPHLNILVHWPWLARKVEESPTLLVPKRGPAITPGRKLSREARARRSKGRVLGACELLDHITAAGWGYMSCAELVDDKRAVAGYIIKHAKGVEGAARDVAADDKARVAGEVTKRSQLPTASPQGFRRIRSGVGFLAPRFKGDKGGCLVRRDEAGNWFPVSRPMAGTRVWVDNGPPKFRPSERVLWLDMVNRRAYLPEWPGWSDLPLSSERPVPPADRWTLVVAPGSTHIREGPKRSLTPDPAHLGGHLPWWSDR